MKSRQHSDNISNEQRSWEPPQSIYSPSNFFWFLELKKFFCSESKLSQKLSHTEQQSEQGFVTAPTELK